MVLPMANTWNRPSFLTSSASLSGAGGSPCLVSSSAFGSSGVSRRSLPTCCRPRDGSGSGSCSGCVCAPTGGDSGEAGASPEFCSGMEKTFSRFGVPFFGRSGSTALRRSITSPPPLIEYVDKRFLAMAWTSLHALHQFSRQLPVLFGPPVIRRIVQDRLPQYLGFLNLDILAHGGSTNQFGIFFPRLGHHLISQIRSLIMDHKSQAQDGQFRIQTALDLPESFQGLPQSLQGKEFRGQG